MLTSTSYRRHLVAAIIAGLVLRIALVLLCREDPPSGDAKGYDRLALNLAEHCAFSTEEAPPFTPTTVRAPFTALALSLPYRLGRAKPVATYALLILVGLAGALTLALGAGRHAPESAVVTLWVLTVSPFGALYAARLLSETFASAAVSASVGCFLLLSPKRAAIAGGAALAVAALTRDVYLPLVIVLPLAAFALHRSGANGFGLRHVGIAFAASACLIAPWTLRNVLVGSPTLVSKGLMGMTLWAGTWELDGKWNYDGRHIFPPEAYDSAEEKALIGRLSTNFTDNDDSLRALAIERMRAHPLRTLGVWVRRSPYLWIGSRTDLFKFRIGLLARGTPAWTILKVSAWGLNLLALGLAVLGAVLVVRRSHPLRLLLIPIAFTALVYFPFHSTENRYSEPVYSLVLVLAVLGADVIRRRFWVRNDRGLTV